MRRRPSGEEAYPCSSSRSVSNSSRRALVCRIGLRTEGMRFDGTTETRKFDSGSAIVHHRSNCSLFAGFIPSTSGGAKWTPAQTLGGPMDLSWLPDTFSGRMVADSITVGFGGGKAFPIFALAQAPTGSLFHQAIYTTASGLGPQAAELEELSSADDRPVPNAKSDHVVRPFVDNEIPGRSEQPPDGD